MYSDIEPFLELDQIAYAILERRPDVEDVLVLAEDRPTIQIPYTGGGSIVVAQMDRRGITRWIVAVPGTDEPTIHEPEDLRAYGTTVSEALEA